MDISLAQTLALTLMQRHGLTQQGWKLRFTSAKGRFGSCSYKTKTINLSREHTAVNTAAEVQDTILHEIAHAKVGPGHRHGPVWKAMAASLGATPKASSKESRLHPQTVEHTTLKRGDIVTVQLPKTDGMTFRITRVNDRTYSLVCLQSGSKWRAGKSLVSAAELAVAA